MNNFRNLTLKFLCVIVLLLWIFSGLGILIGLITGIFKEVPFYHINKIYGYFEDKIDPVLLPIKYGKELVVMEKRFWKWNAYKSNYSGSRHPSVYGYKDMKSYMKDFKKYYYECLDYEKERIDFRNNKFTELKFSEDTKLGKILDE